MYVYFFTVGQKLPSIFMYNVISYLAIVNSVTKKEMVRKVYDSLLKYLIERDFLNYLAL